MSTHLAYGRPIDSLDVVVVEDTQPMQVLLRSMLVACRVPRIRAFDTAEEAFRAMVRDRPSLVICNWRMRPVSGYRLLKALRRAENAPLCFVPLVMISAQATRPLVEEAYLAGAHAFLAKPFAPNALHRTLHRVLRDSRPFVLDGKGYVIEGVRQHLSPPGEDKAAQRMNRGRMATPEAGRVPGRRVLVA